MSFQLLTEHHLEFLSFKKAVQACLSLHLSKCHIVGYHTLQLIFRLSILENPSEYKRAIINTTIELS